MVLTRTTQSRVGTKVGPRIEIVDGRNANGVIEERTGETMIASDMFLLMTGPSQKNKMLIRRVFEVRIC